MTPNQNPNREKTALVTGAARGNGFAIAEALAATGATVYLVDIAANISEVPYSLSDGRTLEDAAQSLRRNYPNIYTIICDVRVPTDVDRAVAAVESGSGRLDILVNNAGVLVLKPIAEVGDGEWDVQMDVIAKGAFNLCRRVLPGMNARGWGRVINIASVAGVRAIGTGVAYTAAKHALIGLTKALAMEVAKQNITVNAVCPGTIPTPLIEGTGQALGISSEETLDRFTERHLTGRPISPADVAAAVVWLASDAAQRVNGTALFVDDGWHVH